MIDRVFAIMLRGKWFLPVPQSLRGQTVKPVYISPITRAQRASEAEAVIRTWQTAALIAESTQTRDAFDVLDPDVSMRIVAEANAVPARAIRTVRQVQELQTARAEIAEQDKALEQAGAGAEVLEKLSNATGELAQAA